MKCRVIWPKTRKHLKEYLAGLIAGDGQIEKKRITITDSSKEFLNDVARRTINVLGIGPKIHQRTNVNAYYMRIYGVKTVEGFRQLITELKSRPTLNFIRGFFDAEGTINVEQGKYIVIEISQHEGTIIANLAIALRDRCIYSYIRYREYYDPRPKKRKTYTRYVLRIKRMSSVYRFLSRVGVRHPKHVSKLMRLRPL